MAENGGDSGVAGYTGVINSQTLVGYTGAEGYTGVIAAPSPSGFTGTAGVSGEARADAPSAQQAAISPPYLIPPSSSAPEVKPEVPEAEPEAAGLVRDLSDAVDAVREDPQISLLRLIVQQHPEFSTEGNDAIADIQNRLDALSTLKPMVVIGPWIARLANTYRLPGSGLPPLIPKPQASPSAKVAQKLGPTAALAADDIVKSRIRETIDSQLIRNLSAEEGNFWRNLSELLK